MKHVILTKPPLITKHMMQTATGLKLKDRTHLYICWWFYPGWPWWKLSCHTFKYRKKKKKTWINDAVMTINPLISYAYQSCHTSPGCTSTGVNTTMHSFVLLCQSSATERSSASALLSLSAEVCYSDSVPWCSLLQTADSTPGRKPVWSPACLFHRHNAWHTNKRL